MRIALSLLLIATWGMAGRPAFAEEHEREPTPAEAPVQMAFAMSSPLTMALIQGVGASLYVGFREHHALRLNVARYPYSDGGASTLGEVLSHGDGAEATFAGRTFDSSIGYMLFPRRLWSGFFVEAALMMRDTNTRRVSDFEDPQILATDTTTIAGRVLIGWSWIVDRRFFISLAVGASDGIERGTETSDNDFDEMPTSTHVARLSAASEGFLRIGGFWDL